MFSLLADVLGFASEASSDPDFLEREHSDTTNFPPRPKTMAVYPLAWIGKRYRFNKKNTIKNVYFIRRFDELSWKRNDESDDSDGDDDCLGRNCLVSHLFAAFLEKGRYVRFGLIKLGKKGSDVDKKRIHLFKSEEIATCYDSPMPYFIIMNIENNELTFAVRGDDCPLFIVRFELNSKEVEKSKILTVSSERQGFGIGASSSNRILSCRDSNTFETVHRYSEISIDTHIIENNRIKQIDSIDVGRLRLDPNDKDEDIDEEKLMSTIGFSRKNPTVTSIYYTRMFNRIEKEEQQYMIISYSYYFNKSTSQGASLLKVIGSELTPIGMFNFSQDEKFPLVNDSIVGGDLYDVIKLTDSHMLLVFHPKEPKLWETTQTEHEKYFGNDITWMILDLNDRIINKIEPLSMNAIFSIDGNKKEEIVNKNNESRLKFHSSCVLRPYDSNPDLFEIILFKRTCQETPKEVNFGKICSYFFKIKSLGRKITFIKSMYDTDIHCQN